jgi:hypothetical protein
MVIWEQTATCATYSINWLVLITEMKSVYSAVRNGSLNKAVCVSSLNGFLRANSDLCHLQHKRICFITEMSCFFHAVLTGFLNKAICAVSLNGYYVQSIPGISVLTFQKILHFPSSLQTHNITLVSVYANWTSLSFKTARSRVPLHHNLTV